MSATITIAKCIRTEQIIHIDEVEKELGDQYDCCDCKKRLIPVKTKKRGKDWHFRHPLDANIAKCRSTALHDYAVQVLTESNKIIIASNECIEYLMPQKEVSINGIYRSDVTGKYDNEDVHFEVIVTNALDEKKSEYYQDNKIKCISIDLSDSSLLSASPEKIKAAVLNNHHNKKMVYWNDLVKPQETSNGISWLYWMGGAIAAFFFLKWLFKKKRVRVFRRHF